jgi:hypothetical protein
MKTNRTRTGMYVLALFVGVLFFLLPVVPEAQAGGVGVHIGIGLPFPGYVVSPPPPPPVMVYRPAPPPVVVAPPYGYYSPYYPGYYYPSWNYGRWGYGRHHGHRW